MTTSPRVAVIGAGPCGLAATKTLREFGVAVECLEAGKGVGGIWNVEDAPGGGYRSLQTNTSTRGMAYSDFPFAEDAPVYPSAAQMVAYFEAYAQHFDLWPHIRFGQRVEQATPRDRGGWRLEMGDGETREFDVVAVATGQYHTPKRPHDATRGNFAGAQLHVYDYLDASAPVDCRGKQVVVVGLGSSAAEVAAELSDPQAPAGHAAKVVLSARSGRWVLPKVIDGEPLDAKSLHPSAPLPEEARQLSPEDGAWAMRKLFGGMLRAQSEKLGGARALGLPEPTIEPWEDRPTMSLDFIPALQAGRIEVRPGIERFDGKTVVFSDGSAVEADVLLYGTGYQLGFPFLGDDILGAPAPDLALYQRIAHPSFDDLFFLGCCRVMCALWPLAEQQSRWLARLLSGRFALPSREERATRAVSLQATLPVMCNFYVEGLRREAGGL
ncbi:MAG: NAD(P)-binding domain-containing protein [Myxococcota bacterium]